MSRRTVPGFMAYQADAGGQGVPLVAKGAAGEVVLAAADATLTSTLVQAHRMKDGTTYTPFSNIHGFVEGFTVDIPSTSTAPGVWFVSGPVSSYQPFLEGQRGAPGLPGTNGVATDEAVGTNMATPGTATRAETTSLVNGIIGPIWDQMTRDVIADTDSATRSLLNALYGGGGGGGVGTGYVNVMQYGAKGDGYSDDAWAIQAALDDNTGVVVLPVGYTFRLKKRLRFKKGNHVMAWGAKVIRDQAAMHMVRNYRETSFDGVEDDFPGYTGNGDIVIEGGTWDNNSKIPGGNTFTFAHARNIKFRGMTCIRNRDHVFDLPGCDGVTIEDVWMLGFNISETHKEAIQIDSCISGAASMRPLDGTITKNVTVRNCRVGPWTDPETAEVWPTCGRFIGSHSVSTLGIPFENIQVLYNVVDGAQSRGINPYGWSGFKVVGNTVRNTVTRGISVSTPAGIVCTSGLVQGNHVKDNQSDFGICVISEGTAADLKNVQVLGNTSEGSSNIGVVIGLSTGCVAGNNHVIGAATTNPNGRSAMAIGSGAVDPYLYLNTVTKSGAATQALIALSVNAAAVRPRYVLNNFLDGLTVSDSNTGSIKV
ncbi:glycosyl hydrolase family 28-related protein [Arthrobacter sp.]|uniref:glycosyl hydrolase family 28-related protein n=1 Tax=Arthrobacter sp. TaxID=1667 RepID=UPI003A8E64F1